ncbi:MAG: anthranilate synthase component I [Candidatus Methanomethylicia archaeon]
MTLNLQKTINHKPEIIRIKNRKSPLEFFIKIYQQYDYIYILESLTGPENLTEYSFIGFDPKIVVIVKNGRVTVEDRVNCKVDTICMDDPLIPVKEIIGGILPIRNSRFMGGAVGYISYDAIRYWEKLPSIAIDDLNLPDLEMGIFTDGIVFNHKIGEVFYYHYGENRLQEVLDIVESRCSIESFSYSEPKVNIGRTRFENMVMKVKNYIASGDIFQVVLSKRYEFRFHGSLIPFYKALRRINLSPYMYYLKMGRRQIVGSSPEMLVRVENEWIETFPIAGTRPRVKDRDENESLKQELLLDPKECAEHVMLVDLARNDVGRVSEFGTVSVPEFMRVYQYSHVQHIVSRVTGKLKGNCDCYDALRAVFPAGTVSGAPKIRAMEIIEECEPVRRGPYAGAVGYFSYNGNADFAITIRTLIANNDKGYIQTGAGIVADSNPEREWLETEYKALAMLKAMEIASRDYV